MNEDNHAEIMKSLGKLEGLYSGILDRLTAQNGKVAKSEIKIEAMERLIESMLSRIVNLEKTDGTQEKESEKRKDWIWGAVEKIVFAVIGASLFLAGLALQHAGIINLK